MNIFKWIFNTTKEPTTTKTKRGTWIRCDGTGKSMANMRKVGVRWYGTCKVCKKLNTAATRKGVATGHKAVEQSVTP